MRKLFKLSKRIYQSPSGINVEENFIFRWVSFDDEAVQSLIKKRHPHLSVIPYIKPFLSFAKHTPEKTLLLGLGGGSCVHELKECIQNHRLTVIEASAEMIQIAKDYFSLPSHPNIEIICDKAEIFLTNNQRQFRHILIDLGETKGFPKDCSNSDFFQAGLDAMDDDGIMCINLAKFEDTQKVKECLKKVLAQKPLCVEIEKNYLLYVTKTLPKNQLIAHLKQNFSIVSHSWDPIHGEVLSIN
jgi:spermidine synthase